MRKTLIVGLVGLFLIITQTSDRTASVNDGSGNAVVVVWS